MGVELNSLVLPSISGIISLIFLILLRAISFKALHKGASKTETKIDDIIIDSIKKPSLLWCFALSLYIAISFSQIPLKYTFYINKTIHIIIIFSITIATANLVGRFLKNYIVESKLALPTTDLFYGLVKGIIYAVGILIILSFLGISIAPLITALGIGGLAVALAFQDTLSNLFAGIHLLVEKSIRVGDFVRLESGQEGIIEDITWRTTRIKMLPNNIIIIPNSKLSQSIVINYNLPEKKMSFPISISVDYSSEPEKIEKILFEETIKGAKEIEGLLEDPEPIVRFSPGFGESSLNFTLFVYISQFDKQYLVQSELRKRIFQRFKEEGIKIPFPQREVTIKDLKGE